MIKQLLTIFLLSNLFLLHAGQESCENRDCLIAITVVAATLKPEIIIPCIIGTALVKVSCATCYACLECGGECCCIEVYREMCCNEPRECIDECDNSCTKFLKRPLTQVME